MARSDVNLEFNTFVGGLLTEANPINYPTGFTLDEENFLLLRNGTRRRRLGLDYEDNSQAASRGPRTPTTGSRRSFGTYLWKHANEGSETSDILVVWSDEILDMFLLDTENSNTATEVFDGFIGGTSTPIDTVTSYQNKLIVSTRSPSTVTSSVGTVGTEDTPTITIFSYDGATVSKDTTIPLKVRDFIGIDDGLDVNERPAALSDDHHYNLLNQGWNDTNITAFDTAVGDFPSNADNMNSGLAEDTGVFTASWVQNANNGTGKVIGGRNIVDPFIIDYYYEKFLEDETGVGKTFTKRADAGPYIKSMTEFGGRLFMLAENLNAEFGKTLLFFSQVTRIPAKFGDCYQQNDPTSRDNSQILDTDGGLIDITYIGKPIEIVTLKDRLIIFGTNGIYELFYREDIFRPQDVSIRKITDEPVFYTITQIATTERRAIAQSITVAGDEIYYFARGGIKKLQYNPNLAQFVSVNITQDRIQTLYNEIKERAKSAAEGIYVPSDNTIRFLYGSGTEKRINVHDWKDTELVYDITLDAWYKNILVQPENLPHTADSLDADASPTVFSAFLLRNVDTEQSSYPVDDNLRYLCCDSADRLWRIARYKGTDFKDFTSTDASGDGYDAPAFMQTGYINAGDTARQKQADYIIPSFIRTETGFTDDGNNNLTPVGESSCMISAYWDYADHANSGKVGTQFEAYRLNLPYTPEDASDAFNYGQSVITTKNKLLGRGRALSLRFETTAGKDCQLLGWNLGFEANARV